jgi:hypothetical protein
MNSKKQGPDSVDTEAFPRKTAPLKSNSENSKNSSRELPVLNDASTSEASS